MKDLFYTSIFFLTPIIYVVEVKGGGSLSHKKYPPLFEGLSGFEGVSDQMDAEHCSDSWGSTLIRLSLVPSVKNQWSLSHLGLQLRGKTFKKVGGVF